MSPEQSRYTFDRVIRMILSAAALVTVLLLLRFLSDVLLPFAAAVVLAYLLNPIVTSIEQRTGRRGLAVGLTLGGVGALGLMLFVLVVPLAVGQVARFQDDIGRLRTDLVASFRMSDQRTEDQPDAAMTAPVIDAAVADGEAALAEGVPDKQSDGEAEAEAKSAFGWRELMDGLSQYRADADTVPRSTRLTDLGRRIQGTLIGAGYESMRQFVQSDEFNKLLLDTATHLAIGGWSVVTFAINLILGLTGLIIVVLYLVFLLMDYREYATSWRTFLPPAYREPILEFLGQFDIAMRRYFRGQSLVALLVGTLFALGFTIIGLPMAVPFGLFVGLLNMVPYLQTVGLVPGVLLAAVRALEGDASFLGSVLLVFAVFAIVQLFQDAVLTPRIMGKATGLRPVAILLGVFIWGKLLGFLGLLLAIPLTCLGIAYYSRYVLLLSAAESKTVPEAD